MPGYADRTVEAARRFIDDPMFQVQPDGTVWKRVGLPDANGDQSVTLQIGAHKYVSIPVKLLVFLKYVQKGKLPEGGDWRVINVDGDPYNNDAKNLKLVEQPSTRRSNIDATLAVQIKTDYENGMSPLQIAQQRGLTVKAVKTTLFGNGR
jgi:hypothetical protein